MSANYLRKYLFAATLLTFGVVAFTPSLQPVAMAQTNVSGDIVGTVTDPQGAVVPGATVTVVSKNSGSTKTVTTSGRGDYRVPLLEPGDYFVTVAAPTFETAKVTIPVQAGAPANGNVTLAAGNQSTTVEVTAAQPLLHTEDAQISTSFTMEQIQSLPNPGNDLTFVAQTSPGAVMNTQGGYGNFSVFGLPATSNTFTVNGGYENDPFLNVNNSGATNLLLGNNDVADVTVTSNAYDSAFGGLGGAQISEISRSGGNGFHGDARYWWNGSSLNAQNYFNSFTSTPKSFDNVNQYAASIGGPIRKDKAFFFVNYEGLRVVLPTTSPVYAPDTSYQNQTLANLVTNGLSSEIPVYQNMFALYNNAKGRQNAIVSTPDSGSDGYGTVVFNGQAGNFTHEYLVSGRVDVNLSQNDRLFGHFKVDKGLQATYTSLLDPVFNADSPQPQYEGQLQETHTFSPSLTNQFLFAAIYYRAIFTNTSEAAGIALVPFTLEFADGDLGNNGSGAFPGGYDAIWPQGRNVTGYQFQDDLSWTKGNHTIKVGWAMRRDDVTDYSPNELTASPLAVALNSSFQQGYVDEWIQQFPTRLTQPVALYTQGAYVQDTWKALPNLTLTYGMRFEHNSNPTCITNCYARLAGGFGQQGDNGNVPFNQLLSTGLRQAFPSFQTVGYEPRVGFSWQPKGSGSGLVIRGGFGMFADSFPAQIADNLLNNAPENIPVTLVGPNFGGPVNLALVPVAPGSAESVATATAAAFRAGFASGVTAATTGTIGVTTVGKISYPTYEEYSLSVEKQIGHSTAISETYVGNHGYHEPVVGNGVNGFGFPGLPSSPISPSFNAVSDVYSGASSNYNGSITTITHRERYLTLQFNYAYSHALDEISNGGFDGFSGNSVSPADPFDISKNYGNADYDTRHYISGSYVFTLPYWGGPHVISDNWQFAGTVFHNNGYPISVVDSSLQPANFGGPIYAQQIAPLTNNGCGGEGHNVYTGTQCPFVNSYAGVGQTAAIGLSRRNQVFGPHFTDTDMDVTKGFSIPHWESAKLNLGAQFFNLFNHANFAQPGGSVAAGNLGLISGTVNTPTSILGSFLGGDAAPRLIQLKASFVF
jgi:hypothetical protein